MCVYYNHFFAEIKMYIGLYKQLTLFDRHYCLSTYSHSNDSIAVRVAPNFTKEMVVVNIYNIINKENTISKHKVNMTIISIVKNMTTKLQSILK